jgi:DNA polymerase III subunit epsilon
MRIKLLQLRRRYYRYRLQHQDLPVFLREYIEKFLSLDLKQPVAETEFVVFDTETTGLHVKRGDRILSISGVRFKNGRIDLSDAFHEMVNPDRDIPSNTAVVHEILPRMVNGRPMIDDVLPRFIGYIGSAILVAHHEWLDMSFLNWAMEHLYGFPLQNIVLDTAVLDQILTFKRTPLPDRGTLNLNSRLDLVAQRYQVPMEEQHSSFWDAVATAQIFQKMIKEAQSQGILSVKDLLKLAFTPPGLFP